MVLKFDGFGHRHAILCDFGCAVGLGDDDIASLRAKGYLCRKKWEHVCDEHFILWSNDKNLTRGLEVHWVSTKIRSMTHIIASMNM